MTENSPPTSPAEVPAQLSPAQLSALFDILSHHNTYAEIRNFRQPGSLDNYGPPFTQEKNTPSTSPTLQSLVAKFALTLPGVRDVPDDFWKVQVNKLIRDLELANLSESYDKGAIGTRKTVATAFSALLEYVVRGITGGFPKQEDIPDKYDLSDAGDLSKAFRNSMDGFIYGTMAEDLVEKMAKTDKLTDHDPVVQALHEFMLVNIASFIHYILILSPMGQYMITLAANVNKLVPYTLIRQTLKIGNVASMINAMMKVVLAKLSVASITNWVGLTASEDTGMNLMQQILSQTLNWEVRDFKGRVKKVENNKDSPSKAHLQCLRDYPGKPFQEQETIRQQSQSKSASIISCILAAGSKESMNISEPTHKLALEYLSLQLAIRDRQEIIRVLCHSSPDHLTAATRSIVAAYEPVIRNFHRAVDLTDTLYDAESFISDLIKLAKIKPGGKDEEVMIPTVGDFVQLLKKHQYSFHKFLHQMCKNGGELTKWYVDWAKKAASQFRQDDSRTTSEPEGAGNLNAPLQDLFSKLPVSQQIAIIPVLDSQKRYLAFLGMISNKRLESVLRSPVSKNPALTKIMTAPSKTQSPIQDIEPSPSPVDRLYSAPAKDHGDQGPGAYLSRWEDLLQKTPLTPQSQNGETNKKVGSAVESLQKPDVKVVVEAMGQDFRNLLGKRGLIW